MEQVTKAVNETKVVLSLPAQWVRMYNDFITKNAGAVGQVEGSLRSLTYIIPGKSMSIAMHTLLTCEKVGSESQRSRQNLSTRPSSFYRCTMTMSYLARSLSHSKA